MLSLQNKSMMMSKMIAKWCVGCVALSMLALTSCLDSNNNTDYDRVEPIAPGISIYNAANSQNIASLQPADVAMRFAILRAEAVKQNKLGDWNNILTENAVGVKNLLFGIGTQISEDEQEPGTFVIQYANGGGQMPYDSYRRLGSVRVRTQGVALEETNEQTKWSVSLASSQLTVSGGRTVTLLSTGETMLYGNGEGGYVIDFFNGISYIEEARKASWNGAFVLTPSVKGTLAFSDLDGASFGFDGESSGTSFWSFNGTTAAKMSYKLVDGQYDLQKAGNVTQLIAGTETCALLSTGDYSVTTYPSPEVEVVWSMSGSRISYTVTYDGNSVGF